MATICKQHSLVCTQDYSTSMQPCLSLLIHHSSNHWETAWLSMWTRVMNECPWKTYFFSKTPQWYFNANRQRNRTSILHSRVRKEKMPEALVYRCERNICMCHNLTVLMHLRQTRPLTWKVQITLSNLIPALHQKNDDEALTSTAISPLLICNFQTNNLFMQTML